MNPTKRILGAAIVALLAQASGVLAQATTEVTANLLSIIQRQNAGDRTAGDAFQVSFGSLNGGLASLLTKDGSADGAAGFAAWYGSNSRTLLNWGFVTGADIVDSDSFYRYYGANTAVETRAGGPLTSIFSNSLDNRALAFVTYSSGEVVTEVGLYDLGFNWGDPADEGSFPLGLYDIFTLASNTVTAVYGTTDNLAGDNGAIYTSTVPEPSSASLMLLGAAGVLALRRLRKNNV